MTYDNLQFHKASFPVEDVLHIELNRPKLLNAMHKDAYLEYGRVMATAGRDPDVRVILLSGSGRALCAGLDVMGMIPEMSSRADQEQSRKGIALSEMIAAFQESIGMPSQINKPVVAVAHGPAIGLAIDILCATDVRFASKDVVFSVREIDIGMAADIGTLQRLPKIVGSQGWVKDVCFSGRNFGADEALAQGFVQYVRSTKDEAVSAALAYCADLAKKSPVALYGTKKSISYAVDHPVAEGLRQIADFNAFALGEDFVQASMAFRSKDKPRYSKL